MKRRTASAWLLAAVGALLLLAARAEAISDADKCEVAKNKIAGKYAFCRQKAEAKAIKSGDPVDYSKCDLNFGTKWGTAETNGGGMCPTIGDQAAMQSFISQCTDGVATQLSGGAVPPCTECGNGAIDAGEDCDQANLNGETCVTQAFAGGTLACGSGCAFDTSGCYAARFVDNADGTITDNETGLMWEKKDDFGVLHDKDNTYIWADAMSLFISQVNGFSADGTAQTGLGGHSDWRLPTSAELQTILLAQYPCGTSPCIDPTFGPTVASGYLSSTIHSVYPANVWGVSFINGQVGPVDRTFPYHVRAVRGGL